VDRVSVGPCRMNGPDLGTGTKRRPRRRRPVAIRRTPPAGPRMPGNSATSPSRRPANTARLGRTSPSSPHHLRTPGADQQIWPTRKAAREPSGRCRRRQVAPDPSPCPANCTSRRTRRDPVCCSTYHQGSFRTADLDAGTPSAGPPAQPVAISSRPARPATRGPGRTRRNRTTARRRRPN
jgi:hypothetical protein